MAASGRAADGGDLGRGLRPDRPTLLTVVALVAIAVLAWASVITEAARMDGMAMAGSGMDMPVDRGPGSAVSTLVFLGAWGVMMAAMMLPSATPMIALYGVVYRNLGHTGQAGVPTALFALVYLIVWLAFGIPVYLASLAVEAVAGANATFAGLLPYALGIVLLGAGAYQFSSLKQVCLRVCRSPVAFLIGRWRSGHLGTLRLGVEHAAYCVGCCWALMAVLVAAGAMGLH